MVRPWTAFGVRLWRCLSLVGLLAFASLVAVGLPVRSARAAAPRVLVLGAVSPDSWNTDVAKKLTATGRFSAVDVTNIYLSPTPTLATLQTYDGVLVFTDYAPQDGTALGNRLADYADGGGKVVLATFDFNVGLAGRIMTPAYSPLSTGGQTAGSRLTLVADIPGHSLLAGVTSFDGGTSSYHNSVSLTPGARLVAHWSGDNQPLVALKPGSGRPAVVALNFYPVSSDARSDFWVSSTDGTTLLANALLYVPPSDLTLTASVSPAPTAPAGQPLTWTFVVTNTGGGPVPGTTFGATLPAGLKVNQPTSTPPAAQPCTLTNAGQRAGCALGTLAPKQAVTITITATMQSVALGTNLCATGQVNGSPTGATVTRQAQACTRVGAPPAPDLVTTLACAPITRAPGEVSTCTLTVTNQGDLAISLPGGVVLGSVVETQRSGEFTIGITAGTAAPPGYPGCVAVVSPVVGYDCAAPAGGDTLAVGASRTWQVPYFNGCVGCAGGTLTLIGRADRQGAIVERVEANNDSAPVTITYTP